jgi:hypothetical protein
MKRYREITNSRRCDFLKGVMLGSKAVGAATTLFTNLAGGVASHVCPIAP